MSCHAGPPKGIRHHTYGRVKPPGEVSRYGMGASIGYPRLASAAAARRFAGQIIEDCGESDGVADVRDLAERIRASSSLDEREALALEIVERIELPGRRYTL